MLIQDQQPLKRARSTKTSTDHLVTDWSSEEEAKLTPVLQVEKVLAKATEEEMPHHKKMIQTISIWKWTSGADLLLNDWDEVDPSAVMLPKKLWRRMVASAVKKDLMSIQPEPNAPSVNAVQSSSSPAKSKFALKVKSKTVAIKQVLSPVKPNHATYLAQNNMAVNIKPANNANIPATNPIELERLRPLIKNKLEVILPVVNQPLGKGAFGVVVKAESSEGQETFALKLVSSPHIDQQSLKNWKWFAETELNALKAVQGSENVVRLYGFFYANNSFSQAECYLIVKTELLDMDFMDAIHKAQGLPAGLLEHYFEQGCSALAYIHGKMVCHNDLKPENFMVQFKPTNPECDAATIRERLASARLVLIDFGLARQYQSASVTEHKPSGGTAVYDSPAKFECSQGRGCFDPYEADCYALGVTMLCAVGGANWLRANFECPAEANRKYLRTKKRANAFQLADALAHLYVHEPIFMAIKSLVQLPDGIGSWPAAKVLSLWKNNLKRKA